MVIEQFGKNTPHFFLSNMYPVGGGIEGPEGVRVPTAENLYQAEKFVDPAAREEVLRAEDGYRAKKVASRLQTEGAEVRQDWPEYKLEAMRIAQIRKFAAGTKMAKMLLSTDDKELIQGNTHGDTFWGVSPPGSRNGENHLGIILMARREELREALHKES